MPDFLFVRKLAEGPATEVYVAHRGDAPGRRVVELLRPELMDQAERVGRFTGEAELRMRELTPGFVPWVEVDRTEAGRPFLLSGPLPPESLRTRLMKRGPLALEPALRLGLALCRVLQSRGGRPLGKLSPDLVFLPDLDSLSPQVVDLSATQARLLPEYRPPESLRNEPATLATDIYGLGLVLWEALTGSSPVRGLSPEETAHRQLEREAPALPERAHALASVVERCLAKRPEERWESLEALHGALNRVLATEQLRSSARGWLEDEEVVAAEPAEAVSVPSAVPPSTLDSGGPGTPRRGRFTLLVLAACLLWASEATPRHQAPLETYAQVCAEAGGRPTSPLESWAWDAALPAAAGRRVPVSEPRCAIRTQLLLPRATLGRRPTPAQ